MTTIYGYAINDSLWTLNYSTYLLKPTWAQVTNGTNVALITAANSFGAFNQTFDTQTFFINNNDDRVGINTTTPLSTFSVNSSLANGSIRISNITNEHFFINGSTGQIGVGTISTAPISTYKVYLNDTDVLIEQAGLPTLKIADTLDSGTLGSITFAGGAGGATSRAAIDGINDATTGNTLTFLTGTDGISEAVRITEDREVGILTTNPQNILNVIGDINATTSVFSQNKNLSVGYDYATNGSFTDTDTFVANYTNFTAIYGYAINDSLWTLNYSTYLLKPTYAQATNGTDIALVTASNTFGNFNQSMNSTTFFLWSLLQRVGIGTTSPQNLLNILGDTNATGTIYAQSTKNLSVGYDYALNNSLGTGISWATAQNGSLLNVTNSLNGSLILGTNLTYAYSLGWQNNATNFTTIYGNQLGNASNMTTIYGYALNDSLWTLNYSTYLLKPTWEQVTNGTNVALVSAANSFGAFNQTFNGTTLFLWALNNRIGIGTTSPQNTLNVVGDANITGTAIISGTPDATGELGRDTTQSALNYYDNGALGTVPKVVAAGVGTESFTNSVTSDQDFTSVYTIPANSLFTNKMYRVTLTFEHVTGTSSVTAASYLKLGSTKVYTSVALNHGDSLTRSWQAIYIISGRAAAGAAADVSTGSSNPFYTVNTVDQPTALATNGALAITPGITYSGTGSTDTQELQGWMVEELN